MTSPVKGSRPRIDADHYASTSIIGCNSRQKKRGIDRRVPDSTLGNFLAALDPQGLRRHLHQQVLAEHRRKALEPSVVPIRAISIDGKTVATLSQEANKDCQKHNPEGQAPYWLYRVARATLISSTAALCIDQEAIPAQTNDMGVFASFFAKLEKTYQKANLYELVSTDAGFTSEANARQVDNADKAYMMAIKGNQPELYNEARRVLRAKAKISAPEAEMDWESDSSRGWIKRQLWRTSEMAGWETRSHLRQVWLVRVLARANREAPETVLEGKPLTGRVIAARPRMREIGVDGNEPAKTRRAWTSRQGRPPARKSVRRAAIGLGSRPSLRG